MSISSLLLPSYFFGGFYGIYCFRELLVLKSIIPSAAKSIPRLKRSLRFHCLISFPKWRNRFNTYPFQLCGEDNDDFLVSYLPVILSGLAIGHVKSVLESST